MMAYRILLKFLLGYSVIAPCALAQWVSDANNCKAWTGVSSTKPRNVPAMNSTEGTVQWIGNCVNGYAEGEGKLVWKRQDGFQAQDTYVGQMKKGMRHGRGELEAREWGTYSGQWQDDELVSGRFTSPNANSSYSGGFLKGHYHGNGVRNSGGVRTKGNWENGELVEVIEKAPSPPPYRVSSGHPIQGNTVLKPKPKQESAE